MIYYKKQTCFLFCPKTSKSQNRTLTSKIAGDLSASTNCRRQLLTCCDQLDEGVSRWKLFGVGFLFSEENPVPDRVQHQTLQTTAGGTCRKISYNFEDYSNLFCDVGVLSGAIILSTIMYEPLPIDQDITSFQKVKSPM